MAVGVLVDETQSIFHHLLAALRSVFEAPSNAPTAKLNAHDNPVGAVFRMLQRNTLAIPLDSVLPVILGVLLFKNDFPENRQVFYALFRLFAAHRVPPFCISMDCSCSSRTPLTRRLPVSMEMRLEQSRSSQIVEV